MTSRAARRDEEGRATSVVARSSAGRIAANGSFTAAKLKQMCPHRLCQLLDSRLGVTVTEIEAMAAHCRRASSTKMEAATAAPKPGSRNKEVGAVAQFVVRMACQTGSLEKKKSLIFLVLAECPDREAELCV
jgi:hypothetical protein